MKKPPTRYDLDRLEASFTIDQIRQAVHDELLTIWWEAADARKKG